MSKKKEMFSVSDVATKMLLKVSAQGVQKMGWCPTAQLLSVSKIKIYSNKKTKKHKIGSEVGRLVCLAGDSKSLLSF